MDLRVAGKAALVTGATGTIGKAISTALAREGARIAVGYCSNRTAADHIVTELTHMGTDAVAVRVRLEDVERAAEVMREVSTAIGPVAILVNNAVAWPLRAAPGQQFEDVPLQTMTESVQANLVGSYALAQAAIAQMRPQGWGRIVHISTGLVEDGFPGSATYTTPKAGLHGLTRTMSRELAADGIFTNLVMAGYVARGDEPSELLEQVSRSAATGRPTEPWEVASLVAFLVSAANGHITGELVRADGHFLTRT